MAKIPLGGTKLWCPECAKVTPCAALPPYERGQRKRESRKDAAIHWFERRRKCGVCDQEFTTVEIEQDYLYELFRLRETMREINSKAEALIKWQQR